MISPKEKTIIDEVGRWKVIRAADLYKVLSDTTPYYTSFCKKLRALEKDGYLAGRYFKDSGKYVHLTGKGARLSSTGAVPDKHSLNHDLICSRVILKLLEFESFSSGSVCDGPESELCPDGVVHGSKNGVPYTLAIEVELSQKSLFRVEKKFADYAEESAHTYAFYITNKKSLFETYRKTLIEMDESIQKMIILSWAENLESGQYDYRKAVYWLDGKQYSFDTLFEEEKNHDQ